MGFPEAPGKYRPHSLLRLPRLGREMKFVSYKSVPPMNFKLSRFRFRIFELDMFEFPHPFPIRITSTIDGNSHFVKFPMIPRHQKDHLLLLHFFSFV